MGNPDTGYDGGYDSRELYVTNRNDFNRYYSGTDERKESAVNEKHLCRVVCKIGCFSVITYWILYTGTDVKDNDGLYNLLFGNATGA